MPKFPDFFSDWKLLGGSKSNGVVFCFRLREVVVGHLFWKPVGLNLVELTTDFQVLFTTIQSHPPPDLYILFIPGSFSGSSWNNVKFSLGELLIFHCFFSRGKKIASFLTLLLALFSKGWDSAGKPGWHGTLLNWLVLYSKDIVWKQQI